MHVCLSGRDDYLVVLKSWIVVWFRSDEYIVLRLDDLRWKSDWDGLVFSCFENESFKYSHLRFIMDSYMLDLSRARPGHGDPGISLYGIAVNCLRISYHIQMLLIAKTRL